MAIVWNPELAGSVLVVDPGVDDLDGVARVTDIAPFGFTGGINCNGLAVRDCAEADISATTFDRTGMLMAGLRSDGAAIEMSDTNGLPAAIATDRYGRVWTSGYTVQQTDTLSAVGSGTSVDLNFAPMKVYGLQVTATGVVTSWTVLLQTSLDGTTWTPIAQHTNTTGTGVMVWDNTLTAGAGTLFHPAAFVRSRVSAIVLGVGTNLVIKWIACP